jgi:hypothetical protein
VIVKQRCSFTIRVDHLSFAAYPTLAKEAWDPDKDREDDQTAHDHESKDPLEGDDMCVHLRKRNS